MITNITVRAKTFFAKPIFHDRRTILWLWVGLSVLAALLKYNRTDNNFRIFRGVFWHTLQGTSLYEAYPAEYFDVNHYGPLFSLIIAPFAVIPIPIGMVFWCIALSLTLYFAVTRSTFSSWQQMFVLWFCSETLLTSLFMQQFNIAIAAIIIASYALIEKERDFWAAFLIVLGTLVKLYGIVGLAFFFFSRHKGRFVLSLLFWSVVLFVAPMIMSSPAYVVSQYHEWMVCLVEKGACWAAPNTPICGRLRPHSYSSPYPTCASSNGATRVSASRCWHRCCFSQCFSAPAASPARTSSP